MARMVNVFTDGSALDNGRATARAGIGIYWGEGDARNTAAPFLSWPYTNNRAELYACIVALEQFMASDEGRNGAELTIHTDSMYVVNIMTKWLIGWKRRGWKGSTGKPVENRDLVSWLDSLCRLLTGRVHFQHVRAHGKEAREDWRAANDEADRLANAGAEVAGELI